MTTTGETNLDCLAQDQGDDEEGEEEEEEEEVSMSSESDFDADFSKLRISSSSVVGSPKWSHFLARPSTPRGGGQRPFAWQSTAKTYTRAALVPSGLVDDVLVVSAEPFWVSEEELQAGEMSVLRREPVVLERLPPASKAGRGCLTDGSMTREERIEGGGRPEPPQRVEWFCYPSGFVEAEWREERPATRSHVFALFADGSPLRGVVLMSYRAAEIVQHGWRAAKEDQEPAAPTTRKQVWVPVAICLLTRLAIVPALCAWVEQLAVALDDVDASVSAEARREALEIIFSCAAQLADEVPRPVAGVLSLKVAGPAKEMVHICEHFAASRGNQIRRASALDRRQLGRPTGGGGSLWLAALLLGPEGLVNALACALLEKSVLLIAQDAALLAPVAEALLALVRPFEWSHVYVPVLPRPLLELLDAPQPFLLGVLSSWLPDDFFSVVTAKNDDDVSHDNDANAKKKTQYMASANKMSRRSSAKPPGTRTEPTARQPARRRPSNRAAASVAFWQATPIAPGTIAFDLDAGTYFAPSASFSGSVLSSDHDALPEDFADAVRAATRALQLAAIEAIDQDAASRQSGAGSTGKRAARLPPATETLLAAETALQAACSNQMRRLLDGCENFLERDDTPAPDDRARLRADEFVGAHPMPHYRPFLRSLCETQHFWQYVDLTREQLLRGGEPAATQLHPASAHSKRDDHVDAHCYSVPPPLPQQLPPEKPSDCSSSGGTLKSVTSSSKKRRRSYRRSVPYEDRSFQVTHEWQLEALFGTDRPPANTRVYRYGLLADLLGVRFDDLWRQLEGDNSTSGASTKSNPAV